MGTKQRNTYAGAIESLKAAIHSIEILIYNMSQSRWVKIQHIVSFWFQKTSTGFCDLTNDRDYDKLPPRCPSSINNRAVGEVISLVFAALQNVKYGWVGRIGKGE